MAAARPQTSARSAVIVSSSSRSRPGADIAANVAKCPSDARLIVFFTSNDVAQCYRDLVLLDRPGTRCVTPADIDRVAR